MSNEKIGVMFVCLGNICRSPTAHGVFESMVQQHNLADRIHVDSAATGDWQIGKSPDNRALQAANKRGYDFKHLIARQIKPQDFSQNHYVLAMDRQNLADLQQIQPPAFSGELSLFLQKALGKSEPVPDPYYGGDEGFEAVLDLVEQASKNLLQQLIEQHQLQ